MASEKDLLKFKKIIDEYFYNQRTDENLFSQKEKFDINNIKYCHNNKSIIFYDSETLYNINNFIKKKDIIYPNIIKIILNKKENKIVSNILIEKNTFISDVNGYYGYEKSQKNIDANILLRKVLLFNCKDYNYNRYLYILKNKEFINLIIQNNNSDEANLKLVQYMDIDMEVKVGIISTREIKIGDRFILL